jgi:hypothetical protein
MAGEFWLTDGQLSRLQPLLPNKPRGVPRVDDRRLISGIVISAGLANALSFNLHICACSIDRLAANFLGNIHLAAAIM